MSLDIVVLIGSLRKASWTRKLVSALIPLAPDTLNMRIVEIGALPLYNEDLDHDSPPVAWTTFREEIAKAGGVLFATPEYNRSIPACLKNALDVGSRPEGKNYWDGMPAAIISVTPYKLGAFGANHALRQALVFTNLPVMQQPEAYIGNIADLLDDKGAVTNDETKELLTKFAAGLANWVATVRHKDVGSDFDTFLTGARAKAAQAYVEGNPHPLDKMVATSGPATFFHPKGDIVSGAAEVKSRYDEDATEFDKDGKSTLDVAESSASGDLAFWCGTQTADVTLGGKKHHMTLRITEVLRRHGDGWIIIHRHADAPQKPD